MKTRFILSGLLSISFLLSACLYRPDITQGNIFTTEQVAQVQAGMSREQVRQILGTPAITDPFHADVDSYIFAFKSGKTRRVYNRRLTITYVNNQVVNKVESPITIEKR